ncbi:MAG TPA: arsenite methyltransferase [Chitinophagaceae bacterium]|nr:arsenite methyltransferase [Chitinophagaceae bacterium]
MESQDRIKEMVRQKYTEIAGQSLQDNQSSCCGSGACTTSVYNIMNDDYGSLEGYIPDADLGLGCGLPTRYAGIRKGNTVIDLGSGAGNDCFVARVEAGEDGRVVGIDFTPAMIEKARENAGKLGFTNVEFRLGDIEKMPVTADFADVIISNCVLNLLPGKDRIFREIYRVLKPGGHFSISDIVLEGLLPLKIREAAEMYSGCVSGALQSHTYLELIKVCGYENITVQTKKTIVIPDDILLHYISSSEIDLFRKSGNRIVSLTVTGQKPGSAACCGPACCPQ